MLIKYLRCGGLIAPQKAGGGTPPFRYTNPGWEMKNLGILDGFRKKELSQERASKAKELTLTSIIAAAYGVGTWAIAPIGYGPIQARITDALIPTSYNKKIGKTAIYGTALGCIVANTISPYGLPDVVIGTLTNLVASYASYKCRNILGIKGKILATVVPSLIISGSIGGILLSKIYGVPVEFAVPSVMAGALISCVGIGLPLLKGLERILEK